MVLGFSAMLLASAVSLPAQAINLVTNGGFVPNTTIQSSNASKSYRIPSTTNQSAIPGWRLTGNAYTVLTPDAADISVSGGGVFGLYTSPGQKVASADGSGWIIQMDGDPTLNANLSQTLTGLTQGQEYIVGFYQAGGYVNQPSSYNQPTRNQFRVTFGSTTKTGALMNMAFGEVVEPWSYQQLTFTASSSSQLLSFVNVGGPLGQPPIALLSGVSVQAVPWETDTLPLVGSTVLFGFGLWAKKKFAQKKLK